MTDVAKLIRTVRGVLWASRIHKFIPLLLLLTNAALLVAGPHVSALGYTVSIGFVFVSTIFGMQLNVLTDAALDRGTKPELMQRLTADGRTLRTMMWLEGAACVGLLALAAVENVALSVALGAYGACVVLYSYNFLVPGAAGRTRFKVFWWGNMIAALGGYFALWAAGFALGKPQTSSWPSFYALAAIVCCVDYAVFLNECAGDAAEERDSGLRTLPALLGGRGTAALALCLLFASLGALCLLYRSGTLSPSAAARWALGWHVAVQTLSALLTVLVVRRGHRSWECLVDSSFWLSRAGAFVLLLAGAG